MAKLNMSCINLPRQYQHMCESIKESLVLSVCRWLSPVKHATSDICFCPVICQDMEQRNDFLCSPVGQALWDTNIYFMQLYIFSLIWIEEKKNSNGCSLFFSLVLVQSCIPTNITTEFTKPLISALTLWINTSSIGSPYYNTASTKCNRWCGTVPPLFGVPVFYCDQ